MKYKYTRKQLDKWFKVFLGWDSELEKNFRNRLLAQKEDRKEWKKRKGWVKEAVENSIRLNEMILDGKVKHAYFTSPIFKEDLPTPSPLEGFEEIEEMKVNKLSYSSYNQWAKIMNKINSLISNQKKLYQYLVNKT